MNKAARLLIVGVLIGISATWVSNQFSNRVSGAAQSTGGDITLTKGAFIQVVTRQIPCDPGGAVVVRNRNGRVQVRAWDKPVVAVDATKRVRAQESSWRRLWRGADSGDADADAAARWLDEIEIAISEAGGSVTIETLIPRLRPGLNRTVDYDVRVPRDVRLEIHTSNGQVDVAAVRGAIDAQSSNGQITIVEAAGMVRARTSNGAIVCREAGAGVELESSNGAISLAHSGPLTGQHSITCATSNGSIRVALPQSAGFTLDARTSNGRISSEFPLTHTTGDAKRTRLAGVAGAGGPDVRLRSSNGSIQLKYDGGAATAIDKITPGMSK
jgi:hypothetical protein